MIDLKLYQQPIQHDACKEGRKESSVKTAIQLDGDDGLATDLGFHSNCLKKVDYVKLHENKVILIELTNLKDEIKECIESNSLLQKPSDIKTFIKTLDKSALRTMQTKLWMEVLEEFKGKWMGSIAFYERLLRRNNIIDDPHYMLVVVLKNDTDPKDLDLLKIELNKKLVGMMGKIDVRLTNEL